MAQHQSLPISQVLDVLESQLEACQNKKSSWSRPFLFIGCLVHPGDKPIPQLFKPEDLVEYTNNPIYKNCKLYFDQETYSPIRTFGTNSNSINAKDPAWHQLCTDLMRVAHTAGMSVISNGSTGSTRKMICTYGIFYDKRCSEKNSLIHDDAYKRSTLNADYRNQRDTGRKLHRRTSTAKPKKEEAQSPCKWKLQFCQDENGFFMKCGTASCKHTGHPPPLSSSLQTMRQRILDTYDKDTLTQLGRSHANAGVGRNYIFSKTGKFMSRSQIRYLYSDSWTLPKSTDGSRQLDHLGLDIFTPPCQLLADFRSRKDVSYSCLFSDAPIEIAMKGAIQPSGGGKKSNQPISLCSYWQHVPRHPPKISYLSPTNPFFAFFWV
jgi:hypothetical protein